VRNEFESFSEQKNLNYYCPLQKWILSPNWMKPWPYDFMINFLVLKRIFFGTNLAFLKFKEREKWVWSIFGTQKFELLSSVAKIETESQVDELMTIRLYDQFSCVKKNFFGTNLAFLIFKERDKWIWNVFGTQKFELLSSVAKTKTESQLD
jgi:hypothetical protein